MNSLTPLDLRLLNEFQHHFPLVPEPYRVMAERLAIPEAELLERLQRLTGRGVVSRVGAVLQTGRVGASTLAAMAVPPAEVERVATLVNRFPEVNHNYEREHAINLWFVVTADSQERLQTVVGQIATQSGMAVYTMPMVRAYHIDLGFPFQ
ncbi:MAG: Lrp/AsnC family transcriptional regulator [Magnetococcus sp. DMHC-8]